MTNSKDLNDIIDHLQRSGKHDMADTLRVVVAQRYAQEPLCYLVVDGNTGNWVESANGEGTAVYCSPAADKLDALKMFSDAVRKIANEIPAPNQYTPMLMKICVEAENYSMKGKDHAD